LVVQLLRDDTIGAQEQVQWFAGKPEEYVALQTLANFETMHGRLRAAARLLNEAARKAEQRNISAVAAQLKFGATSAARMFSGDCGATRMLGPVATPLCAAADVTVAQLEARARQRPDDTVLLHIDLPLARARAALIENRAAAALEALNPAAAYARSEPRIGYFRALALLHLGRSKEASAEFGILVNRPDRGLPLPLYPLWHLGLARSAAMAGDVDRADRAYQQFFTLWKTADPEVPVLIQARHEYDAFHARQ
jgi:tetratricopeptide (TPR) repeat protein